MQEILDKYTLIAYNIKRKAGKKTLEKEVRTWTE